MQLDLFPEIDRSQLTEEMFEAYFECRKNKRNTLNALRFEKNLEKNVFELIDEVFTGNYKPGPCIAFIVNRPVKREVFAAAFRDRVIHHWLIRKLNPLFEDLFINDSYACRVGKGTHFGVQRIYHFIKSCSQNYTADSYILKLDVQGFFMHINRILLFNELEKFIHQRYKSPDKILVLEMTKKVVFNNPIEHCIIKGHKKNWEGLPKNKSLFHSPPDCGLPIGNLTSQVFANFYMHSFDSYLKHDLKVDYYGRYVDDFILVHRNKDYLKSLIPKISTFLESKLALTLHPKKMYFQHFSKGVTFLGTVIKPNRIYISNRIKGNFYAAIEKQNRIIKNQKPGKLEKAAFLSSMNAYLGIMKHYKTYKLRKRLIFKNLSGYWFNHFYLKGGLARFVSKVRKVKGPFQRM